MNKKVIYLKRAGKSFRVDVSDIEYIRMEDHYAAVHIFSGEKFLWRRPLFSIEELLYGSGFRRCHNSYIVNCAYIAEAKGRQLFLASGISLPIGRKYASVFAGCGIEKRSETVLPRKSIFKI